MTNQIYCKPYRFNIDIETCKSRLLIINKEHKRRGLDALTRDQKKCWVCQGKDIGVLDALKGDRNIEPEPVCIDCGRKRSEVGRFFSRLKKCNSCYQKVYRQPATASEVNS